MLCITATVAGFLCSRGGYLGQARFSASTAAQDAWCILTATSSDGASFWAQYINLIVRIIVAVCLYTRQTMRPITRYCWSKFVRMAWPFQYKIGQIYCELLYPYYPRLGRASVSISNSAETSTLIFSFSRGLGITALLLIPYRNTLENVFLTAWMNESCLCLVIMYLFVFII